LAEKQLAPEQVRYVIPTHVHLDHAGGAGSMMAAFPNAELLIHPRGARHMIDPERLIASAMEVYGEPKFRHLYGEILPIDPQRVVEMEDGESVNLGGRLLEFRHTRGHANHHFCVWDKTSRGWFSGDMFGISYPWCRFPRGDYVFPATTPTQFDPEDFLLPVTAPSASISPITGSWRLPLKKPHCWRARLRHMAVLPRDTRIDGRAWNRCWAITPCR
jgi:glyoxylase-like metal-dependent hydrolase (beta-lactamase superfamily II)